MVLMFMLRSCVDMGCSGFFVSLAVTNSAGPHGLAVIQSHKSQAPVLPVAEKKLSLQLGPKNLQTICGCESKRSAIISGR